MEPTRTYGYDHRWTAENVPYAPIGNPLEPDIQSRGGCHPRANPDGEANMSTPSATVADTCQCAPV
jgi:hypothetical protein